MAALLIRGTRLEIKTPSILVNPHRPLAHWWTIRENGLYYQKYGVVMLWGSP